MVVTNLFKERVIQIMGSELGRVYHCIYQNVCNINVRWNELHGLYFDDENNYYVMNQSFPSFFFLVRESLLESLVLYITRITDPVKSNGRQNLTLKCLPRLINEKTLRTKVNDKIREIYKSAKFCRQWRNKIYSHNDKYLALNQSKITLQKGSKDDFQQIVALLNDFVNLISESYLKETIDFSTSDKSQGKKILEIIESEI